MKYEWKVGSFRLLDIQVITANNEIIYNGAVENAPAEIKQMDYNKVELGSPTKVFV